MADAYLQSLLGDGETIRSEASQHPVALIRFALQPILVLGAALVCLAIGMWLTPDGEGLFSNIVRWFDTLLGLVTAGLFILAVFWLPIQAFRWLQRRYLVTDRRVLYVEGVLRKSSADAGLSMITDVGFRQGVIGRRLGYGDLVVATASSRPLRFRQMRDALEFKKAIMASQQATIEARADQILAAKGLAPTVATTAAAVVAAEPKPEAPATPPQPAWDGSDVPQMHEDDAPPSDPAIFGSPGASTGPDDAEGTAEPAGVVDEAAPPDTAEATLVAAATDVAVAEAESVTVDSPHAESDTAEAASVGDEPTHPDPDMAEADDDNPEAPGATQAVAASPIESSSGDHVAALDQADSAIGGLTQSADGSGADSVTSALARLAELRDSGAITAAEFESRKQELLDRL